MPYKTILVHLNDKRRAEALLEPAVRLASRHNAHLIGMHVHASMPAPPIPVQAAKCRVGRRRGAPSGRRDRRQLRTHDGEPAVRGRMARTQGAAYRPRPRHHGSRSSRGPDRRRADRSRLGSLASLDFPERLALESGRPVLVVPYVGRYPKWAATLSSPGRPDARQHVPCSTPSRSFWRAETVQILEIKERGDERPALAPDTSIAAALARHGSSRACAHRSWATSASATRSFRASPIWVRTCW